MKSPVDAARARSSVLWSALENGGLTLVSFVSLIIYSRYLSASDFGVFSIVLALVELFGVVVSMLFHDALVQRENVTEKHFDSAFTFTLVLSAVLLGAALAFAPFFGGLVDNPLAGRVLAVTALCFPATALTATIVARQRRELQFRPLALRSLIGRLSGAAAGILLVVLGAGFWGLVAQQVLVAVMGSLVLWVASSQHPRLRFSRRELGELLGFGVYSVGSLFLTFAVKRVFTVAAGVMLGAEAAGYLNLSFRTVDVLWAVMATAVTQVALPILARIQSDRERLKRAYRSAMELTCVILYPCFIGISVTAPEAVELLFGKQWLASAPYVTAVALLIVVQAPKLLIGPTLTAVGRPRDMLFGIGAEMVTIVVLFATLGAHSIWAAVVIWCARELVSAPVLANVLARASGITLRQQLGGAAVPLLASLTMALAVWAARRLLPPDLGAAARLGALVPIGLGVFLGALWLLDRSVVVRGVEFVGAALRRRAAERPAPC